MGELGGRQLGRELLLEVVRDERDDQQEAEHGGDRRDLALAGPAATLADGAKTDHGGGSGVVSTSVSAIYRTPRGGPTRPIPGLFRDETNPRGGGVWAATSGRTIPGGTEGVGPRTPSRESYATVIPTSGPW